MLARTVLLVSCLSILPVGAAAQGNQPSKPSAPGAQSPTARKDSKLNGALIGAGLGAVVGALIGSAAIERSDYAGFNAPLTFGVIGAGAGAAIGVGIDARLHQGSPLANPAPGAGRVNVSPVLGRHVKGVVASIRF